MNAVAVGRNSRSRASHERCRGNRRHGGGADVGAPAEVEPLVIPAQSADGGARHLGGSAQTLVRDGGIRGVVSRARHHACLDRVGTTACVRKPGCSVRGRPLRKFCGPADFPGIPERSAAGSRERGAWARRPGPRRRTERSIARIAAPATGLGIRSAPRLTPPVAGEWVVAAHNPARGGRCEQGLDPQLGEEHASSRSARELRSVFTNRLAARQPSDRARRSGISHGGAAVSDRRQFHPHRRRRRRPQIASRCAPSPGARFETVNGVAPRARSAVVGEAACADRATALPSDASGARRFGQAPC